MSTAYGLAALFVLAALVIATVGRAAIRAERDRSFDAHADQALAVGNGPAAVDELAARRTR